MTAARLLEHFDRVSEAPAAVPRLRRFILDLAVRGKLVEHDPNDEPAAELLKRLKRRKGDLAKGAPVRSVASPNALNGDDVPFSIPVTWTWCRLSDLGSIVAGGTPPSGDADNFAASGDGIPWLTPADLGRARTLYVSRGQRDLTPQGLQRSSATLLPKGSVLFSSRAPIGYTAIAALEVSTNQGFKSVVPFILDSSQYIATYFQAFATWIDSKAPGTTFREVSGKIVSSLPFPLPPLAEQHRIVAKVDELTALCDRLELAQAERETRHDRVVASSLRPMLQPLSTDAKPRVLFCIENLDRIATRPTDVGNLRRAVLQQAAQGFLTADSRQGAEAFQNPEQYLAQILTERRDKWSQHGANRSLKRYPEPLSIQTPNLPTIPASWRWSSADAVCRQITDGEHIQPAYQTEGFPMLTATHVRDGFVSLDGARVISASDFRSAVARCGPESGDVLVVSVGATTGRAAIVENCPPFALVRSVLLLKPLISARFLLRWLQTPWCLSWMRSASEASAQPHLYIGDMKRMPVPIPSLAEQHRIVAKVDELMAVCDRLEAQFAVGETTSSRLLDALLHDAMADPNPASVLEAR